MDAQMENHLNTLLSFEEQGRTVQPRQCTLFECLAGSVEKRPDLIQDGVDTLLRDHETQFVSVLVLLTDAMPEIPTDKDRKQYYEETLRHIYRTIISSDKDECQEFSILCLYASATFMNVPIYAFCQNEADQLKWLYFPPLFIFEDQPEATNAYITMYMSPDHKFYRIKSPGEIQPHSSGLVGMYRTVLDEYSFESIRVPEDFFFLDENSRRKLCNDMNDNMRRDCCAALKNVGLITEEDFDHMTRRREPSVVFNKLVITSDNVFEVVCKVLIKRRERNVLEPFVDNWYRCVESCDSLKEYEVLRALDNSICERNRCVEEFVADCKSGQIQLDRRRKNVTTAVIAGSSLGVVSGAMVIAGIVLTPVSFGASLGLSIAGGVLGAGTGIASGTARVVDGVTQRRKITDIKKLEADIDKKDKEVVEALQNVVQYIPIPTSRNNHTETNSSIQSGLLAAGSVLKAVNTLVSLSLSAARLSTVAATVMGPFSLAFDFIFLIEAIHSKVKGDKSAAGRQLLTAAGNIDIKYKILNSMLRGNCEHTGHLL